MPILPPATFAATYGFMSGAGNASAGQQTQGAFPQYLGDRFGWETITQTAAKVYEELPPAERSQACIFTSNYGEASALNFFGDRYDLPPAISGHNNYYLWGPVGCTGEVMITVGLSRDDVEQSYATACPRRTTCRCTWPGNRRSRFGKYGLKPSTTSDPSIQGLFPPDFGERVFSEVGSQPVMNRWIDGLDFGRCFDIVNAAYDALGIRS